MASRPQPHGRHEMQGLPHCRSVQGLRGLLLALGLALSLLVCVSCHFWSAFFCPHPPPAKQAGQLPLQMQPSSARHDATLAWQPFCLCCRLQSHHLLSGTKFRRADAEGQLCSWLAGPPRRLSLVAQVVLCQRSDVCTRRALPLAGSLK